MKKALGKGLSALIPDTYVKKAQAEKATESLNSKVVFVGADAVKEQSNQLAVSTEGESFQMLSLEQVRPNKDQPRKEFDPEAIEELASSIERKGILQPIIVRKTAKAGLYEIVCGERRFRAATLCGLEKIPAIIKDLADDEFLEWALIENIQREDLNPLEEAEAYQKLAEEHKISQEEIAKRVGKSRVAITNTLRLLRLPQEIRFYIVDGQLTAGHARALLTLPTPEHQRQLAKKIVEDKLSVRQVEALVNRSVAHKRKAKQARHLTPEIVDLENQLTAHLGTRVKILPKKNLKQGRLEIAYYSLDELDNVIEKMGLEKK
jgi:ParB family chromosome partitioning protein